MSLRILSSIKLIYLIFQYLEYLYLFPGDPATINWYCQAGSYEPATPVTDQPRAADHGSVLPGRNNRTSIFQSK